MATPREDVGRRTSGRRDPRVDPDSIPAMPAVAVTERGGATREEVTPRAARRDPRAESESLPAMPAVTEAKKDALEAAVTAPAESPKNEGDPRLAEMDRLFDRSAWKEIAEKLGPPEEADKLPPALALMYALARREAAGDEAARGATELAIKSMAALLGVAPGSAAALVLAKRLLRQNPATWRSEPAPARLSLALLLVAVALGLLAGSFLSLDAFRSIKLF